MAFAAVKKFRQREVIAAVKNANASSPSNVVHNPFLPRLNPETKRWAPPKYSLRRQADLVKKARESNSLHLLPPGPKLSVKDLRAAQDAAEARRNATRKVATKTAVTKTTEAAGATKTVEATQSTTTIETTESTKKIAAAELTKAEEATEATKSTEVVETESEKVSTTVSKPLKPFKALKASKTSKVSNPSKASTVPKARRNKKAHWATPLTWQGTVKEKEVAGADVGNRLYAGKWRMFKGHKWQRTMEQRKSRTALLVRSMKGRIMRFKATYRRRRPWPLSRPRYTGKPQKLPF